MHNTPPDWDISESAEAWAGLGFASEIHVDKPGCAFKRNAIHMAVGPNGKSGHERMLVGELNGVRCYVRHIDGKVVVRLTTEDFYP